MTSSEFWDNLMATPELESKGVSGDSITIKHIPSKVCYSIDRDTLVKESWPTLKEILFAIRPAKVLSHITRIVGYYSQIDNWNRSKLGELKDRQKAKSYYRIIGEKTPRL